MNKKEIIYLAKKLLKNIPDIKERIRLIEADLNKRTNSTDSVQKLRQEQHRLKIKLSNTIKAISTLNDENQRIICYKYFDKLNIKQITLKVNLSERTIRRNINKSELTIGRIMFGFEDEYFAIFQLKSSQII